MEVLAELMGKVMVVNVAKVMLEVIVRIEWRQWQR